MRIIIALSLSLLLSCNEEKNEKIFKETVRDTTSKNEVKDNSALQEIETLSFRRSYVGHENLAKKELDELYKSNPTLETYDSSSKIFKKLNQLKLLNTFELVLEKFEGKGFKKDYLDNSGKIEITCQYDSLNMSKIDFVVKTESKINSKFLDINGDHIIGILLKDIDDDNVNEILILTNYYIMNGDNYVLTILKYN